MKPFVLLLVVATATLLVPKSHSSRQSPEQSGPSSLEAATGFDDQSNGFSDSGR